MSEFQYYGVQATDRLLTNAELHEVRSESSRAHITPAIFANRY